MALCGSNADWLSLSPGFMEMKVILIKVMVGYGWLTLCTHTVLPKTYLVFLVLKKTLELNQSWS